MLKILDKNQSNILLDIYEKSNGNKMIEFIVGDELTAERQKSMADDEFMKGAKR